ncbi:hypothetical protein M422DRAFT_265576 [Sphaerobolus stellatus SS14]|uniref:Fungal-type protein kinase domain-containing protein n=1 Tax=Sphaerobolus stellatus (strain SS14) TaxID=990650 RepID=A0A0C9V4Z4_SPHS4|nr:hypothetical protein M422DRAFT_265576 [Sphaerobolus stellatus SS14]
MSLRTGDTPPRPNPGVSTNALPTLAKDVMDKSKEDIKNTLFKVDTKEFFDKIIPLKIATVINDFVKEKKLVDMGAMDGEWVDCHHKSPRLTDMLAASVRPDRAFISKATALEAIKQTNFELEKLRGEIENLEKEEGNGLNGEARKELEKKKEEDRLCHLWWLQMANIVEIKCEGSDDDVREALVQLCGGIVGTGSPINIHEEPKRLIQAIATFSILPTEQLGWDPTMSMFCKTEMEHYPSHRFPWRQLGGFLSPYRIQWVVEAPRDREKFISIHSLSLIGAESMCGRGTIVLEVVRLKDFLSKNTQANVYAMKQSWERLPGRQNDSTMEVLEMDNSQLECDLSLSYVDGETLFDSQPFEAEIFKKAGLKGRIYRAGYVERWGKTESGVRKREIVDTFQVIRKGMTVIVGGGEGNSGEEERGKSGKKRNREGVNMADIEASAYEITLSGGRNQVQRGDHHPHLASRRQTRVFMGVRGWPLKFFRNVKELVTVMSDVIEEHQQLFGKGILHRDPSGGNILITIPDSPNPNPTTETRPKGFLIDLDHAKTTNEFRMWKKEGRLDDVEVEAVKGFVWAQEGGGKAGKRGTVECPVSPQELGWNDEDDDGRRPFFGGHIAGSGYRSGTFPYMSHEVLKKDGPAHNGIHDMESFWWIIIHIVLTRAGPGKWREDHSYSLDGMIRKYFDSRHEVLLVSKGDIFSRDYGKCKERVLELLKHMHPYFEPLKEVIMEWWIALYTGFEYEGYEYHNIHDIVLSLLKKTIEKVKDTRDELTNREEKCRSSYEEAIRVAISSQQCAKVAPMSPDGKKGSQGQTGHGALAEPESVTARGRGNKRVKT